MRPIVGLAPMDGVTDAPMRFITAKYGKSFGKAQGKLDVMFTEFVSAEGIRAKAEKMFSELKFAEVERPIVAQLFGKDPEAFAVAAKKVIELGFDGVDINMGCPSHNVTDNGAGAGLIENRELAREIIAAVKMTVSQCHSVTGNKIPVSVKTRIGTSAADESWWEFLAKQDLAAVTMHGRTFKQMYQGQADWESLARAAKVIKAKGTIFLGNGDINSLQLAADSCQRYGVDGVLIGRAAMGNPWVFQLAAGSGQLSVGKVERLRVALEHAYKYEELFPNETFLPMRKHLAHYAKGFDGASELRQKLVLTNSADEVEEIIKTERIPEVSS